MRNSIESIIELSRHANPDWEHIDNQIQTLSSFDPDAASQIAYQYIDDKDSQVRDTTATILEFLDIKDEALMEIYTLKLCHMAQNDPAVFASGRAATFLLKHEDSPALAERIKPALESFKQRALSRGWVRELEENFPNPKLSQLFA